MSDSHYTIFLEPVATNAAAGFLRDDPVGVRLLFNAIDALAFVPEPAMSTPFGMGRRRLHAGRYRAVYEIDARARQILVVHWDAQRPDRPIRVDMTGEIY